MTDQEQNLELRCSLCPHPADTNRNRSTFPHLPLAQAPWTDLPCGHRVHTICYALQFANDRAAPPEYYRCNTCNEHMFNAEQREWFRQQERNRWREPDINFEKLWDENETFREDIRNFKEKQKGMGALEKTAKEEIAALRTEFRDSIRLSVECIREQKAFFKRRLQALQSRKKLRSMVGRSKALQRRIEATYDLSWNDLERIKLVRGVPKFRTFSRWSRWCNSSYYLTRVVI